MRNVKICRALIFGIFFAVISSTLGTAAEFQPPGSASLLRSDRSPVTVIVAAFDTQDKGQAEYICSGINDDVVLQAAINSLPAQGGAVVLLEGMYFLSKAVQINKRNVTIQGQDRGAQVTLATGANSDVFQVLADPNPLNSEDATFRNLIIDGNKTSNPNVGACIGGIDISNVNIEHCFIRNCRYGINFSYTTSGSNALDNTITDSWVTDNQVYGVRVNSDSALTNSFIGKNGKDMPTHPDSSNVYIDGWDSRVTNNHIWDGQVGILGHWANDNLLLGNIVEEHQREGLLGRGRFNGWRIIGNYFEDNSLAGVNLTDALTFSANPGETAQHNVIVANRFGKQDGTKPNHRYAISEGVGGDHNLVSQNITRNGYQLTPGIITSGSQTLVVQEESGNAAFVNADVAIRSQGKGLVLRATNGNNCYRLTVDNAGVLKTTALPSCH